MRCTDLRIGLSDDITSLGSDHHTLSNLTLVRIFHRLKKAARDTRSSLDAGFVIELAIAICWAVLDPMTWKSIK